MSVTSYKMVLLGDREVGKSSLISQFTRKKFDSYYDPTIDEIFEHWIEIDGEWRELELFDTAGNEEFSVMKDHFIRKGEGFLLVYSVTDEKSFENIRKIYDQISSIKAEVNHLMILVGNKVDLVRLRKVAEEQGREMAEELNIPYIETSANKPPFNVDTLFIKLFRLIGFGGGFGRGGFCRDFGGYGRGFGKGFGRGFGRGFYG